MEIKGRDIKYKTLGIGLWWAPIFGGVVNERDVLTNEQIIGGIIISIVLILVGCFEPALRFLLRKHSQFRIHYLSSHIIAFIVSLILSLQFSLLISGMLYLYIGFFGVKCLESM